jgi:hypothetical protein
MVLFQDHGPVSPDDGMGPSNPIAPQMKAFITIA